MVKHVYTYMPNDFPNHPYRQTFIDESSWFNLICEQLGLTLKTHTGVIVENCLYYLSKWEDQIQFPSFLFRTYSDSNPGKTRLQIESWNTKLWVSEKGPNMCNVSVYWLVDILFTLR